MQGRVSRLIEIWRRISRGGGGILVDFGTGLGRAEDWKKIFWSILSRSVNVVSGEPDKRGIDSGLRRDIG